MKYVVNVLLWTSLVDDPTIQFYPPKRIILSRQKNCWLIQNCKSRFFSAIHFSCQCSETHLTLKRFFSSTEYNISSDVWDWCHLQPFVLLFESIIFWTPTVANFILICCCLMVKSQAYKIMLHNQWGLFILLLLKKFGQVTHQQSQAITYTVKLGYNEQKWPVPSCSL